MPDYTDRDLVKKIAEFLAEYDSETIMAVFEDVKKLIEAKEHLKDDRQSNGNGVGSG